MREFLHNRSIHKALVKYASSDDGDNSNLLAASPAIATATGHYLYQKTGPFKRMMGHVSPDREAAAKKELSEFADIASKANAGGKKFSITTFKDKFNPYMIPTLGDKNYIGEVHVSNTASPGALAHELGHLSNYSKYKNPTLMNKLYSASRGGTLALNALALPASFFANSVDDRILGGAALGGAAISAPMLAEELSASMKGYKMLRKLGKGRLTSLGAFAGVPTYLASAALPSMPYFGKKLDSYVNGGQPT